MYLLGQDSLNMYLLADIYQYYNVPAIQDAIDQMDPSSTEGYVTGVWNAILHHQFPPAAGYIARTQEQSREEDSLISIRLNML